MTDIGGDARDVPAQLFPYSFMLVFYVCFCMTTLHAQGSDTTASDTEVRFRNGGVTLGGTLSIPGGPGPHPALVFITGSGPQNRNCVMSGFPLFKVLSDMLVAEGFAVLRYDDRGVDSSGGTMNESTLEDFASDVEAAIRLLESRADIRKNGIGVVGHSEGGAVAQIVAARTPLACAVMLAGPGASIRANILLQTELIHRANRMPEGKITREVGLLCDVFDTLSSGKAVTTLFPRFVEKARADRAEMSKDMQRALSDLDQYARMLYKVLIEMMDTRWFRSVLAYDPQENLGKLICPLLALYGEKDLQVPAFINAPAVRSATAYCQDNFITVHIFPGQNHLFQQAGTGSPMEYQSLPKTFGDGFAETIIPWLKRMLN